MVTNNFYSNFCMYFEDFYGAGVRVLLWLCIIILGRMTIAK